MTLEELRTQRRQDIPRVAAARGAHDVCVFGSVARGDSDDASDVDFLVELEPGRTLFNLSGLLLDLEALLDTAVDVVTERGLRAANSGSRSGRSGASVRDGRERPGTGSAAVAPGPVRVQPRAAMLSQAPLRVSPRFNPRA